MRPSEATFRNALAAALAAAAAADEPEEALRGFTGAAHDTLGDRAAASRPGALREGERDHRVAGVFLVTPDERYNMLVASVGFPAEQRRLMIPLRWNHPGRVVETGEPILLRDTDAEGGRFRQFLKSARMGSSVYAPFRARGGPNLGTGRITGQIVAAAQARGTYDAEDLARLQALAAGVALAWRALDGAAWLAAGYPPPDAWRAEDHGSGEAIS